MSDMDFTEWGREIGDKIEEFINSKEMKDLQENIRHTVEDKMADVRRSAKEAAEYVNKNIELQKEGLAQRMNKEKQREYDGLKEYEMPKKQQPARYEKRQLPVAKRPKGRVAGVLLSVFGTCGAIAGWTAALFGYSLFMMGGILQAALLPSSLAGVFAGICTVAAVAGDRKSVV